MFDSSIHLAPNAPWLILAVLSVGLVAFSWWAYHFSIPPLPALARRALPFLRGLALVLLIWLLAQPVIERTSGGRARLVVLLDRSRSMDLPTQPGGGSRAAAADRAVDELKRAWQGRAAVEVVPYAARLAPDSNRVAGRHATALGDALAALALSPEGQNATGVVVVSDGAVNAGEDPVAAGRALGLPVHAVVTGSTQVVDRVVTAVEASSDARVGKITPVKVRIASTEERGRPINVRLLDGGLPLGRATVVSPGGGAEAVAEFRVTPARPGLAVWTAHVDSLEGEISTINNARQVAVEVAPGRLEVMVLSRGLNWDLAFVRRALAGDSSLSLTGWVRGRAGWEPLDGTRAPAPTPEALRGKAVVVLDALAPGEISDAFDQALAGFLRNGGSVMVLGGPAPGLARLRGGRFGADLALAFGPLIPAQPPARPSPSPEARELLAWDDDPARGERAWRSAAPLSELAPLTVGGGDRVLIEGADRGPGIMVARRSGRGQALLVNGVGLWRWALSGHDELTAERARRLWRALVRWLAEPVQGEPLRVRPERWLATAGEPVRLFATLQDLQFRPVAGAAVAGEVIDAGGRARSVEFVPGAAGTYAATIEDLAPGRYRVSARAARGGAELGRATSDFAVDRWSLEEARTLPDSAALASLANATGGRVTGTAQVGRWARSIESRALARGRTESTRLWESPWLFGVIVGALEPRMGVAQEARAPLVPWPPIIAPGKDGSCFPGRWQCSSRCSPAVRTQRGRCSPRFSTIRAARTPGWSSSRSSIPPMSRSRSPVCGSRRAMGRPPDAGRSAGPEDRATASPRGRAS